MLKLLNTYRSLLFGLLIFSYVFSVFQKPIFETVHFIGHVPSLIFSQGKIHSFVSHAKELHSHENLAAFYTSIDENEEPPTPQNEQETKKKIEIVDQLSSICIWKILSAKKQFQINLPIQFVFKKIPIPPPQFA